MRQFFEVSTTNYDATIKSLTKSLDELQNLLDAPDGYRISKPVSRFGWTFFNLIFTAHFQTKIEKKFSDMIEKYRGKEHKEKFTKFITDYFSSRGCDVKLKMIESD